MRPSKQAYQSNGSRSGNLLAWLDARLPITSLIREHLTHYYVPKNFNFWYVFGVLALVVLLIQFVSGIFLAMHYKPEASMNAAGQPIAFASIEYIMREVNWGWLIRYMHSTGASLFFVVVYLHMFRGMLYGSYRSPRELVWVIGMLIFFCLMAEAFFGYLLPWGQMSYWGSQVVVKLFSAIPVVGDSLSLWIGGDFVVGDATLNRFFAFHVIAVPLVFVGLVVLHIIALHQVGSGNPEGTEIYAHVDEHGIPLDGIPFHPYYTVKDFAAVIAFLFVFALIVFFAPDFFGYFLEANNFIPADPMKTPEHIAPLWYFTPFYSMLRSMTTPLFGIDARVFGLLAMSGASLILVFLPWLDRSQVKSIRYRGPIYKILLGLWVVSVLVLGYLGCHPVDYQFFGLIPGVRVGQMLTAYYFLYFLTMPYWSKRDSYSMPPSRLPTK